MEIRLMRNTPYFASDTPTNNTEQASKETHTRSCIGKRWNDDDSKITAVEGTKRCNLFSFKEIMYKVGIVFSMSGNSLVAASPTS